MAGMGLLLASALGKGLESGVESYQQAERLRQSREQAEADAKARKLGLLLQAAKEGFNIDDAGAISESETGKIDRQLERDYKKSVIEKNKADAKKKSGGGLLGPLTPGETAVDKAYGKEYVDFTTKGINSGSTIEKIEQLANDMEATGASKDELLALDEGGALANIAPDFFKSRKMIKERDQARNFANTTLKELFGGQLSDAEREAAAKEYYNEALPREENIKIMRQKVAEIKRAYEAKRAKAKHFEERGTLKGFKGLLSDDELMSTIRPQQPGGLLKDVAPADPLEGRTATDKKTGQKLIRKGGKWVPAN